jgi:carbonic anhydrase
LLLEVRTRVLTRYLEAAVRQAQGEQASDLVEAAIRQNVLLNVEQLRTSEPVLAGLVKADKVRIVDAIYDLTTGRVTVMV